MRKSAGYVVTVIAVAVVLTTLGCASRGVPDAAKVEQEITEARAGESALVLETISDKARAARFLELLDKRDKIMRRYVDVVSNYRDEILAMNADYSISREQFENRMESYNEARSTLQTDFSRLIDGMKKETTGEEWETIAKYQMKKLNPRDLAFKQSKGGA